MGRITKISDTQKRLQGRAEYVKNVPDAKPILELWPTPAELKAQAREFYESIGKVLVGSRVLTELDRHGFIILAKTYQQLSDMQGVLDREGYTVERYSADGQVLDERRHPALIGFKEALAAFLNLAQRFGLSPYDRRRIDLPIDENADDATRKFLGLN